MCLNMVAKMDFRLFLVLCVTLSSYYLTYAQNERRVLAPPTKFTCQGRASGYYADVETGCQVYHMCDEMGRKFSYSCPNTTLFQQRMLVCDHWYMVNCSKSESDYDANLLIGQRDKPFVSDEDMRSRTPRPDILSVPPNSNFYDGLKEAESKFPIHPGNSISGIADSIFENNELDSGKQSFRPVSTTRKTSGKVFSEKRARTKGTQDNINEESQKVEPTFIPTVSTQRINNSPFSSRETPTFGVNNQRTQNNPLPSREIPKFDINTQRKQDNSPPSREIPTFDINIQRNKNIHISPPSRELSPPFPPITEKSNVRGQENEDPVFSFIKRFDPNLPESHKTSMTKTQIIDINKQLPLGQASSEEERLPRKQKNFSNNSNQLQTDKKISTENRFDSVNIKPASISETADTDANLIPVPERRLLPPKTEYSPLPSTTMGPPIYYEWKWAVPAYDLEPPKISNTTNTTNAPAKRKAQGKRPFSEVRTTTEPPTPAPLNTEYNISSYFVPDYVFPLDQPHPGYDGEDAETSFHVKVARPGRASYGENEQCPQCHPAYVKPGTCEPCIVKR